MRGFVTLDTDLVCVGQCCTALKALEIYWEFGQDSLHDTALLEAVLKAGASVQQLSINRLLLEDADQIFPNDLSCPKFTCFDEIAVTFAIAFPNLKWLELTSCLVDMNISMLREFGPSLQGVCVDLSGIGLDECVGILECLASRCRNLRSVYLVTCDYYHPLIYDLDNSRRFPYFYRGTLGAC